MDVTVRLLFLEKCGRKVRRKGCSEKISREFHGTGREK
jgi:hypothetical protein